MTDLQKNSNEAFHRADALPYGGRVGRDKYQLGALAVLADLESRKSIGAALAAIDDDVQQEIVVALSHILRVWEERC